MLGFSLTKLIFTALLIAAVWYGFKWIGRLDKARKGKLEDPRTSDSGPAEVASDAEDMVKCAVCGSYGAAKGASSCGRGDCPYPG